MSWIVDGLLVCLSAVGAVSIVASLTFLVVTSWRPFLRRYLQTLNGGRPLEDPPFYDPAGEELGEFHWTAEGGYRHSGDPGPTRAERTVRREPDLWKGV